MAFIAVPMLAAADRNTKLDPDDAFSAFAGQSLILSSRGERTMRTCLEGCQGLQPEELRALARSRANALCAQIVVVSGYALYTPGLAEAAVELAAQVCAPVSVHDAHLYCLAFVRPLWIMTVSDFNDSAPEAQAGTLCWWCAAKTGFWIQHMPAPTLLFCHCHAGR